MKIIQVTNTKDELIKLLNGYQDDILLLIHQTKNNAVVCENSIALIISDRLDIILSTELNDYCLDKKLLFNEHKSMGNHSFLC